MRSHKGRKWGPHSKAITMTPSYNTYESIKVCTLRLPDSLSIKPNFHCFISSTIPNLQKLSSFSLMAEEEFQEADVVFSDHDGGDDRREVILKPELKSRRSKSSKRSRKKEKAISLPMKIPERIFRRTCSDDQQLEEEWSDEGMVPPYVIADRRVAGKMAFSVCTGNGRTLKGRDLSEVRNSILRMTGFLEA